MMTEVATVKCYANLALLKYWGVNEEGLPLGPSLSIPLANCRTKTKVHLVPNYETKEILFLKAQNEVSEEHIERVRKFIDRVLYAFGAPECGYRVRTINTVPMGIGLASSASGFASLTMCLAELLKINVFDPKLLNILAKESGSALRSLRTGLVEWKPKYNDVTLINWSGDCGLVVFACIVDDKHKRVSSKEMHKRVSDSPFMAERLDKYQARRDKVIGAMREHDWDSFIEVINEETLSFLLQAWSCSQPEAMLTQNSIDLWSEVISWQENEGLKVCVSFDAGPTVLVLAAPESALTVQRKLTHSPYVQEVIVNEWIYD